MCTAIISKDFLVITSIGQKALSLGEAIENLIGQLSHYQLAA